MDGFLLPPSYFPGTGSRRSGYEYSLDNQTVTNTLTEDESRLTVPEEVTCRDSAVKTYLTDVLSFLTNYSWIYDFQLTHILNGPTLQNIPTEWSDFLRSLNPGELNKLPSDPNMPGMPESLRGLVAMCEQLSLPRQVVAGNWCPVQLPHAETKGMSPKKRHEVSHLGAIVRDISLTTDCPLVVDVGAGMGYLSAVIAKHPKLRVLALECREMLTHGTEARGLAQGLCENLDALTYNLQDSEENFILLREILRDKLQLLKQSDGSQHDATPSGSTVTTQSSVACSESRLKTTDSQENEAQGATDTPGELQKVQMSQNPAGRCETSQTSTTSTVDHIRTSEMRHTEHTPQTGEVCDASLETSQTDKIKTSQTGAIPAEQRSPEYLQVSQTLKDSSNKPQSNAAQTEQSRTLTSCEGCSDKFNPTLSCGSNDGFNRDTTTRCLNNSGTVSGGGGSSVSDKEHAVECKEVVDDWSRGPAICMIGLHCCGSLTPTMMKLFVSSDEIRSLVCVSCCYHSLQQTEDKSWAHFPMSRALKDTIDCKFPGFNLSVFGLRLAAQQTRSRWASQSEDDHVFHRNNVGFRALLQLLCEQEGLSMEKGKRHIANRKDMGSLHSYVSAVLKRTSLEQQCPQLDAKLRDLHEREQEELDLIEPFTGLQVCMQPVLECLLLTDRILFLREAGVDAKLVPIFDDAISPRNLAIIATKQ